MRGRSVILVLAGAVGGALLIVLGMNFLAVAGIMVFVVGGSSVGSFALPYVLGGFGALVVGGCMMYLSVRRGRRKDR